MTDKEDWEGELLSCKSRSDKIEQEKNESEDETKPKPVNNRKNDDRFICEL